MTTCWEIVLAFAVEVAVPDIRFWKCKVSLRDRGKTALGAEITGFIG